MSLQCNVVAVFFCIVYSFCSAVFSWHVNAPYTLISVNCPVSCNFFIMLYLTSFCCETGTLLVVLFALMMSVSW